MKAYTGRMYQRFPRYDYGYVGAGRGKISLYKKKECIEKNIPEEEAVEKLIELIRDNGDYIEK